MNRLASRLSLGGSLCLVVAASLGCQTARPQGTVDSSIVQTSAPAQGGDGQSAPARSGKWFGRKTKPGGHQADAGALPGLGHADFKGQPTPEQRILTHLDFARVMEQQGKPQDALEEYKKGIAAFEAAGRLKGDAATRARMHRRMASALDRLGRFDESREHYHTAQKLAPRDANVWNDSGYSAYLQHRWDDAERDLRKALQLDPMNPRFMTNLGLVLAASGRVDAALELMSKAGGPAHAHANLAFVLASTGDHAAAKQHYQSALAIQPGLPAANAALTQIDRDIRRVSQSAATTDPSTRPAAAPVAR